MIYHINELICNNIKGHEIMNLGSVKSRTLFVCPGKKRKINFGSGLLKWIISDLWYSGFCTHDHILGCLRLHSSQQFSPTRMHVFAAQWPSTGNAAHFPCLGRISQLVQNHQLSWAIIQQIETSLILIFKSCFLPLIAINRRPILEGEGGGWVN